MPPRDAFGRDTLAVHAGQSPESPHGSLAAPIHFTAGHALPDTEAAAALVNLERPGHVDARFSNPTTAVFEERVAALEGGLGAVATASGQAALHLSIATLMGSGGHIVAAGNLGEDAHRLLAHTLPRFGVRATFVDARDADAWRAAIGPATRLLFGASLGGAGLDVLDIPAVAAIAHDHGVPLLVDATLATPCLQRPLELGADLVLHSATEFLGGHGVAVGGVLVDGGRFDWEAPGRFPTLTEPCEALGGTSFVEESAVAAFLLRARLEGLRDFGACLSPMNAFQLLQGLETLPLRMRAHSANACAVALHLAGQPLIGRVAYPGLDGHPDHALAARLLPAGAGAVLSIELAGGRAAAAAFIEALRLATHAAAMGGSRTLACHPASASRAGPAAAGLGEGTVRLSVGLERVDDILADLDRGLYAVAKLAQA